MDIFYYFLALCITSEEVRYPHIPGDIFLSVAESLCAPWAGKKERSSVTSRGLFSGSVRCHKTPTLLELKFLIRHHHVPLDRLMIPFAD